MLRNLLFFVLISLAACAAVNYSDFGAEYLGAPYVNDPLGEGAGYDTDPLIRTDAFDCLTYVETVLACGDVERLTQIRYADGVADFTHRNHFFVGDWLKNNADLVENISANFGRPALQRGITDRRAWFNKNHGMNVDVAPVDVEIMYVPYADIQKFDVDVPTLVAFVVNRPGADILVSHVGFLLPGGVLRHASSSRGAVVDMDFREYVASRTGQGVAFFKIKEMCK